MWWKNKINKKFETLISSDRYVNSNYEIQMVNGYYALKNKNSGKYVDLRSSVHEWTYGDKYTEDCLGSIRNVMSAFYFKCPNIRPINIEKTF